MPGAGIEEYRALLLRKILRDLSGRAVKVELDEDGTNRLLHNLRGLTLMEAQKILTKAILEDGRLSRDDIRGVIEAKRAIVEREGLLEYHPAEEKMEDIADLAGLKDWLDKRRWFLTEPERAARFGLSFPKGVLPLGVQGCGKSLCAKAVAMEWGLPLLSSSFALFTGGDPPEPPPVRPPCPPPGDPTLPPLEKASHGGKPKAAARASPRELGERRAAGAVASFLVSCFIATPVFSEPPQRAGLFFGSPCSTPGCSENIPATIPSAAS